MPLLASLALLGIGSTLTASLIGIEMSQRGFPGWTLGLIAAGFAIGGILGANIVPKVIGRVGHIHTFSALAALLACVVLGHVLTAIPVVWIVQRLLTGIFYYGLILIAESWLNGLADDHSRGRLLSSYMVIFLGSGAVGQLLLNLAPALGTDLFVVAGMILVLCVVPISLLGHSAPSGKSHDPVPISRLVREKPLLLVGAFCGGVVVGTYFALGAVYAEQQGLSAAAISVFLAAVIIGALALLWPIGRLSDRFPRKYVISAAAIVTTASAAGVLLADQPLPLTASAFVFGGAGFSLYSLNLAHAGDGVPPAQMVGLSRSFLTVFAFGSAAGPLAAGSLIGHVGVQIIFLLPAAAGAVLTVTSLFSTMVPRVAKRVFVLVPMASHAASSLDPRKTSHHPNVPEQQRQNHREHKKL